MKCSAAALILLLSQPGTVLGFTANLAYFSQQSKAHRSSSLRPLASSLDENKAISTKAWQADLEELLSPTTPPGRRQILLQQLLNANQEIRASVQKALQERDVSHPIKYTDQ